MADNSKENVKIAGSGTVSGGVYESVSVAGSGTIKGDIEAKTISTAGSAKIEGSVKTEELKTAGTCKISGSVKAGEIKTAGSCTVDGNVKSDLFKSSGSQKIGGCLTAKYIRIQGYCKVGGDIEADKFVSKGSFKTSGLLSADKIDIQLGANCKSKEIGGERIEVKRKGLGFDLSEKGLKHGLGSLSTKLDKLGERFGIEVDINTEKLASEIGKIGEKIQVHLGGWGSGTLEAELIEGDELNLEWTKAKTVRGKNVTIGEGCEIDRVEYYETLQVHEGAEVGEKIKL